MDTSLKWPLKRETCIICLEHFKKKEIIKNVNCGNDHMFHLECL